MARNHTSLAFASVVHLLIFFPLFISHSLHCACVVIIPSFPSRSEVRMLAVSYCCCNKLSQMSWFKTTHTHYFTVPWFRSLNGYHWPKTKVSAGLHSFLEALRKDQFSCFFWLLEFYSLAGSSLPLYSEGGKSDSHIESHLNI